MSERLRERIAEEIGMGGYQDNAERLRCAMTGARLAIEAYEAAWYVVEHAEGERPYGFEVAGITADLLLQLEPVAALPLDQKTEREGT